MHAESYLETYIGMNQLYDSMIQAVLIRQWVPFKDTKKIYSASYLTPDFWHTWMVTFVAPNEAFTLGSESQTAHVGLWSGMALLALLDMQFCMLRRKNDILGTLLNYAKVTSLDILNLFDVWTEERCFFFEMVFVSCMEVLEDSLLSCTPQNPSSML